MAFSTTIEHFQLANLAACAEISRLAIILGIERIPVTTFNSFCCKAPTSAHNLLAVSSALATATEHFQLATTTIRADECTADSKLLFAIPISATTCWKSSCALSAFLIAAFSAAAALLTAAEHLQYLT